MIRLSKYATVLQTVLTATAVLVFCSSGQTQTAPSLSITPPANGATINGAYIGVGFNLTGISNVTGGTLTITDKDGHSVDVPISGQGQLHGVAYGTQSLIPSGATSYNGVVTLKATATGTNTGYPPPPPVTVTASPVQITVQVGYILGASSMNTATVTSPLNGATLHLVGTTSFTISSKHKFDFFRYDAFGSYNPTVSVLLQTTYPALAPYTTIENEADGFQLPLQPGDVYREFPLTHQELWSSTSNFSHQFLTQAASSYPTGTEIASDVTMATAIYP